MPKVGFPDDHLMSRHGLTHSAVLKIPWEASRLPEDPHYITTREDFMQIHKQAELERSQKVSNLIQLLMYLTCRRCMWYGLLFPMLGSDGRCPCHQQLPGETSWCCISSLASWLSSSLHQSRTPPCRYWVYGWESMASKANRTHQHHSLHYASYFGSYISGAALIGLVSFRSVPWRLKAWERLCRGPSGWWSWRCTPCRASQRIAADEPSLHLNQSSNHTSSGFFILPMIERGGEGRRRRREQRGWRYCRQLWGSTNAGKPSGWAIKSFRPPKQKIQSALELPTSSSLAFYTNQFSIWNANQLGISAIPARRLPRCLPTSVWSLPFSPPPLWRSRQSQMLKHSLMSVLLFVSSGQCALGTAVAQLRTCMTNADGNCYQRCIKTFGYPLSASPHLIISLSHTVFSFQIFPILSFPWHNL